MVVRSNVTTYGCVCVCVVFVSVFVSVSVCVCVCVYGVVWCCLVCLTCTVQWPTSCFLPSKGGWGGGGIHIAPSHRGP